MTDLTRKHRHWSITVGRIGFSFVIAGVSLLFYALFRSPVDGVGEVVKETQFATYAELQQAPLGELRLIEGIISEQNESLAQGMVAYQRYHGVLDIRDDLVWSLEETTTPELQIEMPGGAVSVSAGYSLFGDMPHVTVGTERYSGVSVRDTVLVVGTVINDSTGTRLQTTYLIHGSRQEHQLVRFNPFALGGGCVFVLVGFVIMAWLLKQGYRPFGDWTTGK